MSPDADVAKAADYMLKRWQTYCRCVDDGGICPTNNAAERALQSGASRGCKRVPIVAVRGRRGRDLGLFASCCVWTSGFFAIGLL
jgi:hypothetical protein